MKVMFNSSFYLILSRYVDKTKKCLHIRPGNVYIEPKGIHFEGIFSYINSLERETILYDRAL